jgi:hypothetical protein
VTIILTSLSLFQPHLLNIFDALYFIHQQEKHMRQLLVIFLLMLIQGAYASDQTQIVSEEDLRAVGCTFAVDTSELKSYEKPGDLRILLNCQKQTTIEGYDSQSEAIGQYNRAVDKIAGLGVSTKMPWEVRNVLLSKMFAAGHTSRDICMDRGYLISKFIREKNFAPVVTAYQKEVVAYEKGFVAKLACEISDTNIECQKPQDVAMRWVAAFSLQYYATKLEFLAEHDPALSVAERENMKLLEASAINLGAFFRSSN